MAKVSVSKLGLQKKDIYKDVVINEIAISVKTNIDMIDKVDIIDRAIGSSMAGYGVDQVKADGILHYYILLKQTNLSLKEEGKTEDALNIVDQLTRSGGMSQILAEISEEDYSGLLEEMNAMIIKADNYLMSASVGVQQVGEVLMKMALEAQAKITTGQ